MKNRCILSLVLGVGSLLAFSSLAQTIYRCGNSYSQTPCAGGNAIAIDDSRDKTQKAQTDAAVRRDLKAAATLEKNRTKQEASRARASRPYNEAVDYDMPLQDATIEHTYEGGKKTKKPEFFTAKTMGGPHPKKKAQTTGHAGSSKPGDARP